MEGEKKRTMSDKDYLQLPAILSPFVFPKFFEELADGNPFVHVRLAFDNQATLRGIVLNEMFWGPADFESRK